MGPPGSARATREKYRGDDECDRAPSEVDGGVEAEVVRRVEGEQSEDDRDETAELVEATGLERVGEWVADGRTGAMNGYVLLRAPAN